MNTLSSLLKFIANSIAPIISDQTAKKVLAAPVGATGKPSFRELGASDITSGTLAVDRVPNLDTSKITSGVFPTNRIPDIDASKTTSGVFASARIPNLSMDKVPDALAKSELKYQSFTLDNKTMSSMYDSWDIDVAVSGYKLLGVVGVYFSTATTNGQYATYVVLRGYWFNTTTNKVTVYARRASSDYIPKIKIHVSCLYKAQ